MVVYNKFWFSTKEILMQIKFQSVLNSVELKIEVNNGKINILNPEFFCCSFWFQ
jgi:hypothetical protein